MEIQDMPILVPVPIETKGKKGWQLFKSYWGRRKWVVWDDWFFKFGNMTIRIPAGTVFDGASVPRVFWWALSPTGILLIGSILHDVGYHQRFLHVRYGEEEEIKAYTDYTKENWDTLFLKVNQYVNGMALLNNVAYKAVKYGGSKAYHSYDPE